jgi:hypothetical protein
VQHTLFFLISPVLILFWASMPMVSGQEQEWITYEDPFLGIKVQHPSDWTKNITTESTVGFYKMEIQPPGFYTMSIRVEDLHDTRYGYS